MAIAETSLSHVYPLGARLNAHGVLELGGCDALQLAREFGTPAYIVVEDDLRERARAYIAAGRAAGHEDLAVVYASKASACTALLRLFAQEGLWCDVASGGELHLALAGGFPPERLLMHGNAKSLDELRAALRHRLGLIVIDNFDEIERLALLVGEGELAGGSDRVARAAGGIAQPVLIRATPDVRGDTHEKISTGQANSKFGFGMEEVPEAIRRVRAIAGLELQGIHAHVGSQLLELEPFRRAAQQLSQLGVFPTWDLGGGLGVAYTASQHPPSIEDYVGAVVGAAREYLGEHSRLLIEPGRSLTANAGVTLYTVESVKRNVSTWVGVDGGMSDNLRPMLYDASYEAEVVDRFGGDTPCVLAGKHCESGDVIVREALLDNPRPGDVIVTPVTGAYGHAMANNYNGVPRPPIIFCSGGDARVVVRRESFDDLNLRDVA
ncbi:MAG TPA: diaminopimelate decarboxylase [Solirubrobacteraceae bacterium]|jgi:diaminopimelate decarboxylase|nr:diaminopimelate decarboxylase [Solirubrobacteraceae bacterium]